MNDNLNHNNNNNLVQRILEFAKRIQKEIRPQKEFVAHKALHLELVENGFKCTSEPILPIYYTTISGIKHSISNMKPDLVLNHPKNGDIFIIELKCDARGFPNAACERQLESYIFHMRRNGGESTNVLSGLAINFNPSANAEIEYFEKK